ncbi:MAG: bifunctional indole-3-glycerol-phosphate synthase TrpC/phosphoribosylanthranilate isomerase TrpF [Ktedonobacteraceae bacterium]|nr:bifunctional indole-3-glycerol-phosphate synthase TrpC/phosphoribosylanthranilate isomerase TrpF [Ktedonobacteraceae bacterium]
MFLERIVARTRTDLQERKQTLPLEELRQQALARPRPRDLLAAFEPRSRVHLIAEVKRASPSKGMLAPHLEPVEQARLYAANGAAAISVLTEPHFFLGSPEYLTAIKQAVDVPVLRKDFIFDEYQVYEARAWGADAILLICAILDDAQLRQLLQVAHSLQMRCLVEVHSIEEAQRAVEAGARIIGVNSRDLVTFQMNPNLVRDLRHILPPDRVIIAESGIHTDADARRLARYDVQGMLVGESLVVSDDVAGQMHMLLRGANESTQVKICGLRAPEHIDVALEAGADLLGLIFYPPSHRYIEPGQVRAVLDASSYPGGKADGASRSRPDLVGVFVNEEADFINDVAEQLDLHFVQLHGHESPEFCQRIRRPVIKALHLEGPADLERLRDYQHVAWRLLLDTPTPSWGGTGASHDWQLAGQAARQARILLAGGLDPANVGEALRQVQPWGVDVSSGVETDRQKDSAKIRAFVQAVREAEILHV